MLQFYTHLLDDLGETSHASKFYADNITALQQGDTRVSYRITELLSDLSLTIKILIYHGQDL